jgi:hypothetical protein
MSKFRINKGVGKLMALSNTLRNKSVPLEYKKMLISGIITPTVLYGSELFGMNETRCSGLKKVVDQGLGMILGNRNFCRNRAYEEFDLKPIQIKAALSRARGYKKWSESKGFIKDLINTSGQFKSKKHTWCKTTKVWLKRFRINIAESISLGRKEVLDEYYLRIQKRDHTLISREANKYKFGSGKKIRKLQLSNQNISNGLYHLTKLRTGTYQFTNKLVFSGFIDPGYTNKCAFCKKHTIENTEHLLIHCSAWNEERRTFLEINGVNNNNPLTGNNLDSHIKSVLGGNNPASGRKPADWIIACGSFLSAIARKRSVLIADLKRNIM